MGRLKFRVENIASGSKARAGRFHTLHNEVLTPLFMPVGTHATVRGQKADGLLDAGSQILLANTYHLHLRPGPEIFQKLGGIHNFMNWSRSVLTDSGGFQIFAMPNDRHMSEEGAKFLSYVDGKHILLTPELSIGTQKAIGSDIMMVLDQCVPSTVEHSVAKAAMDLSCRWALRSLAARGDSPQSLFAIVQGACYQDLRVQCADFLIQHPFDGFALGGLAVGETKNEREDTVEYAAGLLPAHRPRYLMGVGTPIDLLEAVHRGMDMFDCIIPTAHAEQGVAYTWKGKVLLRRGAYRDVDEPIDPSCQCYACKNHSKAYLHHLIKTREFLGRELIGLHNIYFYHDLMRTMRKTILENSFAEFYRTARESLVASDEEFPILKVKPKVKKPQTLGVYEVVASTGFSSIRHTPSGEVMHSVISPEIEAEQVYVQQSQLRERIKKEDIVLWDIGLGAGANAMAAIRAYEELDFPANKLQIYSFENDMDAMRLAAINQDKFSYLRHSAPHALLERGEWKSKKFPMEWKLFQGDFFQEYPKASLPQIVFFDPFSHKTNSEFWSVDALEKLKAHFGDSADLELFTYSASTAVRAAFLAGGFYVARGIGTGPKSETTIACLPGALERRKGVLLGREWYERWLRSDAKMPFGVNDEKYIERVKSHPQFQGI